MKLKKSIALGLASLSLLAAVSGCVSKGPNAGGKTTINVGLWPNETQTEALASQNDMKDRFMSAYPNIIIKPDTYKYDTKTFVMKAAGNQLPTLYSAPFTEVKQIIAEGYASDITEQMKAHSFDTAMNPDYLDFVSQGGKLYGVPYKAYVQGFYVNKKIFKDAGLVNADGSPKTPETWEEVAEFAKIIKDKTGKAGIVLPTTNNAGGWQFLNIAWGHGVEFCKQRSDGTWEATFNTPEAVAALQYYKDLKWKYDVLVTDKVVDQDGAYKYFGTSQAAMLIADPPKNFKSKFGLDNDKLHVTRMPAGPKGRFAQMGGDIWFFAPNSTPEQIEAGLTWLEFTGVSPSLTEQQIENAKISYQQSVANGGIVLDRAPVELWINEDNVAKSKAAREPYVNIDPKDYEKYYTNDGVTIKEEPVCAQQLYAILDGCIQEVITNKDADVAKLIEAACKDYQLNHLDKMDMAK